MKKKICILLALVMLFGLFCGCSSAISNEPDETTLSTTESTTYEITTSIESTSESTTEEITIATSTAKTTEKQTKTSTTKRIIETQKQTITEKTTAATTSGCENGNHSMSCGDIGKWFDSRSKLVSYYNSVVAEWNRKVDNGEISREEYRENCPAGYECWSCSYCGKWTGNFKYQ